MEPAPHKSLVSFGGQVPSTDWDGPSQMLNTPFCGRLGSWGTSRPQRKGLKKAAELGIGTNEAPHPTPMLHFWSSSYLQGIGPGEMEKTKTQLLPI